MTPHPAAGMAALFQRGRSRASPTGGGFARPSLASFAAGAPDSSDPDSDDSDDDMAVAPPSSRATETLEDRLTLAITGEEPLAAYAAATAPRAAPQKAGFLRRLGALRRSVSPAKRGAAAQQHGDKSPQKPLATARESAPQPDASDPNQHRQQNGSGADSSRSQEAERGAGAEHTMQGALNTSRMTQHSQPLRSHALGERQGSGRSAVASRAAMPGHDSMAARPPEVGSHAAAVGPTPTAVTGFARSGSDASSMATETTAASSGVSLAMGNARTAADSYGGSVFASALNQEAGLQLLSQVLSVRQRTKRGWAAVLSPAHHFESMRKSRRSRVHRQQSYVA